MKIIYLANSIYEKNNLQNSIEIINKRQNNDSVDKNLIIYGGNQLNSDEKVEENKYSNFLTQMNKLSTKFTKYILYGNLDLDMTTNCNLLTKYINNFKKDKNFKNIFNIDYKLIGSDTIMILFNNYFNITDNMDANINDTCLKHLITLDSAKFKDNMKVRDLVELEINELVNIIKKNINIKSIIFVTQTPLVVLDYINKKSKIDESIKYIEIINRYSYLLYNLNLYWICGNLLPRNEHSIIKIDKKDKMNNKLTEIVIEQYIVGSNFDKTSNSEYDNIGNIGEEYNSQFEIGMDLVDSKWQLNVNYLINYTNTNYGYLEFNINSNEKNSKPNFEFIDTNKIIDEKQLKVEDLKKNLKSQTNLETKILNNIEFTTSDSNNVNTFNQLTEEGDPYKSKYIKYKKKLYNLRNNKKY